MTKPNAEPQNLTEHQELLSKNNKTITLLWKYTLKTKAKGDL